MITATIFVVLFLWPQAIFAWNEPDGFRGVPWGGPEEQLKKQLPVLGCGLNARGIAPERQCSLFLNIGSVESFTTFGFRSGGLSSISILFKSKDFATMQAAFIEKYGRPTEINETKIKTRAGLEVPNRKLRWDGTKVFIELTQYSGTINDAYAEIMTVEETKEQSRRFEEQQRAGAKDL